MHNIVLWSPLYLAVCPFCHAFLCFPHCKHHSNMEQAGLSWGPVQAETVKTAITSFSLVWNLASPFTVTCILILGPKQFGSKTTYAKKIRPEELWVKKFRSKKYVFNKCCIFYDTTFVEHRVHKKISPKEFVPN